MEKTRKCMILLGMCLLFLIPAKNLSAKGKAVQKKEIRKVFIVEPTDKFIACNRHGAIRVSYWNKNEVEIRIEIEAEAETGSKAKEFLDKIRIDFSQREALFSAMTNVDDMSSYSSKEGKYTINYFILLPQQMAASLSQKYGSISMPDENFGLYDLTVKYGKIEAGNFSQPLKIEAKYSSLFFGNLAKAEMEIGYCDQVVTGNIGIADIESKYSGISLNKVNHLTVDEKYGNLTIGELGEYLDLRSFSYGKLKVQSISPSFRRIEMNARYSDLKLRLPVSAAFRLSADNIKYGNCKISRSFQITDAEKNGDSY
ncbi:MAG: hypothetical protein RR346_09890, partial [Bacteroidales bacterium]